MEVLNTSGVDDGKSTISIVRRSSNSESSNEIRASSKTSDDEEDASSSVERDCEVAESLSFGFAESVDEVPKTLKPRVAGSVSGSGQAIRIPEEATKMNNHNDNEGELIVIFLAETVRKLIQ